MVEKTIEVSGKEVKFRSSAAVPRLYRAKFKRDIFKDFSKLEKSYKDNTDEGESFAIEDLEIFENVAYFKVNEVHIELYTDRKDLTAEQKVEAVLDRHGIFYNRSETWIESEQLYEVLYYFDMEVKGNA